jgi:hypothetical protein
MDDKQVEQMKNSFEEIREMLKDGNLSAEERKKFESLSAQLAGKLASAWLPCDWGRRSIMLLIFLIGVVGFVVGSIPMVCGWILLPLFSPRITGEVNSLVGYLVRFFRVK